MEKKKSSNNDLNFNFKKLEKKEEHRRPEVSSRQDVKIIQNHRMVKKSKTKTKKLQPTIPHKQRCK